MASTFGTWSRGLRQHFEQAPVYLAHARNVQGHRMVVAGFSEKILLQIKDFGALSDST
jgi:hypothetical protein